jgi:WD40 repeat protein
LIVEEGVILAGTATGILLQWDADTFQLIRSSAIQSGNILTLLLTNDFGLLTSSSDGTSKLISIPELSLPAVPVSHLAKSYYPGHRIAVFGDQLFTAIYNVYRFNLTTGEFLGTIATGYAYPVNEILAMEDGTILTASFSTNNGIRKWNASTGALIWSHFGYGLYIDVRTIDVLGNAVLSGDLTKMMQWNYNTGASIPLYHSYSSTLTVNNVSSSFIAPFKKVISEKANNTVLALNGRIMASSSVGLRARLARLSALYTLLGVFDYPLTWSQLGLPAPLSVDYECMAVTSEFIYVGLSSNTSTCYIYQWNRWDRVFIDFLSQPCRPNAGYMSLVIQKEFLFAARSDLVIDQWNLQSNNYVRSYAGHTNAIISLTTTEYYLISGSLDGNVNLWSVPEFPPAPIYVPPTTSPSDSSTWSQASSLSVANPTQSTSATTGGSQGISNSPTTTPKSTSTAVQAVSISVDLFNVHDVEPGEDITGNYHSEIMYTSSSTAELDFEGSTTSSSSEESQTLSESEIDGM